MANDVFMIMARKSVSPFFIRKIIVILIRARKLIARGGHIYKLKKKFVQMKQAILVHPVVFNNKM